MTTKPVIKSALLILSAAICGFVVSLAALLEARNFSSYGPTAGTVEKLRFMLCPVTELPWGDLLNWQEHYSEIVVKVSLANALIYAIFGLVASLGLFWKKWILYLLTAWLLIYWIGAFVIAP